MKQRFLPLPKLFPFTLLFFWCTVFVLTVQAAAPENNRPSGLTVNFLAHAGQVFLNGYPVNTPLEEAVAGNENYQFAEIAQKKPFFGWIVPDPEQGTMQTAYRVLVASSAENLTQDKGDYWDSGKVGSGESVNITYAGKELQPGKVYFWKVKTWDNHGFESGFSAVARFKMAAELVDYATARYPLQKQDENPVAVRRLDGQVIFADFGKDAFGRLRLTLYSETSDDTVTVHLGEALKNGRINPVPGGTIRYSSYKLTLRGGWNTYVITVKPDKRNTGPQAIKMPAYTGDVTPFRYCELEGYQGSLNNIRLVRETVFYPFDETESFFTSSDTILNQVWALCKYSMKATSFAGIYVDGDRERIPYEADAYINQLGHYGVAREYSIARFSHEYLIHHATWPTEWILQSVLMAWNDYLYTGNHQSLEQFYQDLKAKTLTSLADGSGLVSTRTGKVTPELLESIHLKGNLKDIVDWPQSGILGLGKKEPGETDGFVFRDINTVVNAYHYQALKVMAEIARVLGRDQESISYAGQAEKLKKVFNSKLLDRKRGIYLDGEGTDHASLHANMFPLAFGLAPEKNIRQINGFIRSRGMACSVYGSQFLMDAVYDGNDGEYGLEQLTSDAERSWYNMIRAGSTITMEAWDNKYKPNQDWNHAWGAAPANIIPRKLMGIEPLEPGFRKIRIKPQPGSLKHAEIKCPTVRGDVLVAFDQEAGKIFQLRVTIPANSTADIYLPFMSKSQKIKKNGKDIDFVADGNDAVIRNIGSGSYEFSVGL